MRNSRWLNRWLKIDDYQFRIESFGLRNEINTQCRINNEILKALQGCIQKPKEIEFLREYIY